MNTKKIQILGQLGEKIYKQNEEPVDAPDGTLWIDLDATGNSITVDKITASSEDNGKFLMVVDGVPTWVSITNAEEASV